MHKRKIHAFILCQKLKKLTLCNVLDTFLRVVNHCFLIVYARFLVCLINNLLPYAYSRHLRFFNVFKIFFKRN